MGQNNVSGLTAVTGLIPENVRNIMRVFIGLKDLDSIIVGSIDH